MTRTMTTTCDELAAQVVARPARLGGVRLVAVDGRAGSGKTTLSKELVGALRGHGLRVAEVHTDDLLDGWGSITSYWERLRQSILDPLASGRSAQYHRYDWESECFARDTVAITVPDALVVEGVASLGACGTGRVTMSVGMTAPRATRLDRGVARDGARLREHWERWVVKEDEYFANSHAAIPEVVLDGLWAGARHRRQYAVAGYDSWRAD